MKLHKLIIQNFMRFGARQTVSLSKRGLVLIEGINKDDTSQRSNGAGKSSVAEALLWCLYGTTTHDPPAVGDDVVNDKYGADCFVEVRLTQGKSKYSIRRGRRCSSPSLKRRLDGKATAVAVYKDGESITKGSSRSTQAVIDSVLGMSKTTFRHTVIFGQSKAYRFAHLSDVEKKAVLDDLIGTHVYADAAQEAKARAKTLKEEVEALQRLYDMTSATYNTWVQQKVKATNEALQWVEAQTNKRESLVRDIEARVKKLRRQLRKEHKALAQHDKLCAQLEEAKAVEAQTLTAKGLARDERAMLQQALRDAKKRLDKLLKLEDTCPTCEQAVTSKHQAKLRKAYKHKLERLRLKLNSATDAFENARTNHKAAWAKLSALDDAVDALAQKKAAVAQIEERLRELESSKEKTVEAQDVNPFRRFLADVTINITMAQLDMEHYAEQLQEMQRTLAMTEFWVEAFSTRGIRSMMLDHVVPYLNARVESYIAGMTDGNIKVTFSTERELKGGKTKDELHVQVSSTHGASRYNMSSIGERAKIDLCIGLALQDMAAHHSQAQVNVAFFDEPFDGLDDVAMGYVTSILAEAIKERDSVFVITHEQTLKAFFSNTMYVVKENKESTIQ